MERVIRKIRRWSKRSKLLAISDRDLEKWLASLGILDRVRTGGEQCFICGERVDINNIQMVSQIEGEIVLVCDKPGCIYHFAESTGRHGQ